MTTSTCFLTSGRQLVGSMIGANECSNPKADVSYIPNIRASPTLPTEITTSAPSEVFRTLADFLSRIVQQALTTAAVFPYDN